MARSSPAIRLPTSRASRPTAPASRLKDFRGRKLVMYFYPMDDTPGCTKQACSLRDHNAEIAAKGAAILGVSTQDEESHRRFTAKYRLNFPLLADEGGVVGRAYGTIGGGGLLAAARALVGHGRARDLHHRREGTHRARDRPPRRGQPRRGSPGPPLGGGRSRAQAREFLQHRPVHARRRAASPGAPRRAGARCGPRQAARVLRRHEVVVHRVHRERRAARPAPRPPRARGRAGTRCPMRICRALRAGAQRRERRAVVRAAQRDDRRPRAPAPWSREVGARDEPAHAVADEDGPRLPRGLGHLVHDALEVRRERPRWARRWPAGWARRRARCPPRRGRAPSAHTVPRLEK